jgi:hypothetical protein
LRFSSESNCVGTTRGWTRFRLVENPDGIPIFHDLPVNGAQVLRPTQVAVPNSGWATCFRTSHVAEEIFSEALQKQCDLRYSDEIVLSAMLTHPKYVVPMPARFYMDLRSPVHQWRAPITTAAKVKQLSLLSRGLRCVPC